MQKAIVWRSVGNATSEFGVGVVFAIGAEHDLVAVAELVGGVGVMAAQMFKGTGAAEDRVKDRHALGRLGSTEYLHPFGEKNVMMTGFAVADDEVAVFLGHQLCIGRDFVDAEHSDFTLSAERFENAHVLSFQVLTVGNWKDSTGRPVSHA